MNSTVDGSDCITGYTLDCINPGHPTSNSISAVNKDAGGWFYDGQRTSSTFAKVVVNCQHLDIKGNTWNETTFSPNQ